MTCMAPEFAEMLCFKDDWPQSEVPSSFHCSGAALSYMWERVVLMLIEEDYHSLENFMEIWENLWAKPIIKPTNFCHVWSCGSMLLPSSSLFHPPQVVFIGKVYNYNPRKCMITA